MLRSKSTSMEQVETVQIVCNNLLCYATTYMHSCTKDHLTRTISQYYTNEEICEAKVVLHKVFNELGEPVERRASLKRSEQEAHCSDIIDALVELDSKGKEFSFGSLNASRLPKWEPNIFDFTSMAQMITAMENRLKTVEFNMAVQKTEIDTVRQSTEQLSDSVSVNKVELDKTSTLVNKLETEQKSVSKVVEILAENKTTGPSYANVTKSNSKPMNSIPKGETLTEKGALNQKSITNKKTSAGPLQGEQYNGGSKDKKDVNKSNKSNEDDNDGFEIPPAHRRKMFRKQIVKGTGENKKIKGGPMDYFVYRVDKTSDEEKLKEYLNEHSINVIGVKLMSHPDSKYNSFKVSVAFSDIEKVNDPNNWPCGVMVCKFNPRNKHERK